MTFNEEEEEESSVIEKTMSMTFDKRKSGAQYRGEYSSQTDKPDGRGFKVFPNGSIYEGFFEQGQTHGKGRGVTSRGEVYEGDFKYDMMDGKGLFIVFWEFISPWFRS